MIFLHKTGNIHRGVLETILTIIHIYASKYVNKVREHLTGMFRKIKEHLTDIPQRIYCKIRGPLRLPLDSTGLKLTSKYPQVYYFADEMVQNREGSLKVSGSLMRLVHLST